MLLEETTGTQLCGDLFSHLGGDDVALTSLGRLTARLVVAVAYVLTAAGRARSDALRGFGHLVRDLVR